MEGWKRYALRLKSSVLWRVASVHPHFFASEGVDSRFLIEERLHLRALVHNSAHVFHHIGNSGDMDFSAEGHAPRDSVSPEFLTCRFCIVLCNM